MLRKASGISDERNSSKFEELRRRAEELLKNPGGNPAEFSDSDILQLLHELEVHQIELQLQNEELRRAGAELQDSRKKYSAIYNLAPIGYVTTNGKGIVVSANLMASNMLDIPGDELIGCGFSQFVHTEDHGAYFSTIHKSSKDGFHHTVELRLLRSKTAPFFSRVEIGPSRDGIGRFDGGLIIFADITESKRAKEMVDAYAKELEGSNGKLQRANEELRSVPAKLIEVQENERKHLAQDLHDGIAQTLVALKFSVENVLNQRDRGDLPAALKLLDAFVPTLQRAIEESRSICMGLRPSSLDDLGLIPALRVLCLEFGNLYPMHHVEPHMEIEEVDIPEILKITIFRIAQESLNNVAKHSKAEWVDLSLLKRGPSIELTIADDGIGMDLDCVLMSKTANTLGLIGMRERAKLTEGKFSIASTPGLGTTIRVVWSAKV